jgi:hypothetical protein
VRGLRREGNVDDAAAGVSVSATRDRLIIHAVGYQSEAEVRARFGDLDGAERAAVAVDEETASYDRLWFDRCPALAPLRGRPRFEESHERVKERAAAVLQSIDHDHVTAAP